MEKKIIDLETLTDKQLLEEFADRVMAYEESTNALNRWKDENDYSEDDEFNYEFADLKIDNDEDFCRVREVIRFIKKDETIWEC